MGFLEKGKDESPSPSPSNVSVMEKIRALFAFKAKDTKTTKQDAPAPSSSTGKSAKLEIGELTSKVTTSTCCRPCFKILFLVLSVSATIWSVAEIVVTVSTAIVTRLFGDEQSGRLVAMVVLAVLAAGTISILIYAKVAVIKNATKPLHAAAIVLVLIAIIQAIILGVAVRITARDEAALTDDLQSSFRQARQNNPRHAALWASTQHELTCCGVNGPEDYRTPNMPNYFSPNIPISCCPGFDPDRSELVQERKREECKARKAYYDIGCKDQVLEGFRTSATMVTGITTALIVLEITLSIIATILYRKMRKSKRGSVS